MRGPIKEDDERQIREALRQSVPPIDAELRRDLWPAVLRKIDTLPAAIAWYDWALIGASCAVFVFFPQMILVFAYHL